jgi:hypothetical protein
LTTPTDQGPADRCPIGFWLKVVDRLIDEGFDAMLGEAGLTRRHATLTEAGAAAHAELLRKVSHSRQRLSAHQPSGVRHHDRDPAPDGGQPRLG